jgi:hypothetical protein
MRIAKETGGCTISYAGKDYTWKTDGAAIQVPRELGRELLSIRGAGYSEPEDPAPSQPARPPAVTEPEPAEEKAVTEPAPAAKAPVTEAPAKSAPAK